MYSLSAIADYVGRKKLAAGAALVGIAAIVAGCGGGSGVSLEEACSSFERALQEQYNAAVVVAINDDPPAHGMLFYRDETILDELIVSYLVLGESGDHTFFLAEDIPRSEQQGISALLQQHQRGIDESLFSCHYPIPPGVAIRLQQQGKTY